MHGRTCFSVGGDRLARRAICDEAMSEIQLKGCLLYTSDAADEL